MTNEKKYKTADERVKAFSAWCNRKKSCNNCVLDNVTRDCTGGGCQFHWLALEAEEEKPEPCPFCGGSVNTFATSINGMAVHGISCFCGYRKSMPKKEKIETVIAAHNRVCRAVEAATKYRKIAAEKGEEK